MDAGRREDLLAAASVVISTPFLRFDWAENAVLKLPMPAALVESIVDHAMSLEEFVRVLADHEFSGKALVRQGGRNDLLGAAKDAPFTQLD